MTCHQSFLSFPIPCPPCPVRDHDISIKYETKFDKFPEMYNLPLGCPLGLVGVYDQIYSYEWGVKMRLLGAN